MRARHLTISMVSISVAVLAVAMPAAADTVPAAKPSAPAAPIVHKQAFVRATQAEIQAALRTDPLSQAAFFETQFDHDPTNAALGLDLSNAERTLGRYQEAADTAHAVLLFAPNNTDALLAAARAHISGNNAFYAIEPLKQLSALKPNDWQAWSLLGVAYDQTKRPADAQVAWQTALKLSPNNPAVLTNLAMARLSADDLAGAEPLMRLAVAQKASTLQERQDLALVLGLEGKLPEAEQLMRQDLPPEVADANMAWLQQNLQRHAQPAAATPTPVATTAPADAPARTWAGLQSSGS
jgi:Flp pilus assembly protein TadD